MDVATYAILLAGALAGGFVSGLAGFGTALMALGIWLYILPPAVAVPLVLICSVSSQISTLPSTVILDTQLKPRLVVEADFEWDRIKLDELPNMLEAKRNQDAVKPPNGRK